MNFWEWLDNLFRVWNHSEPTGDLEVWRNYRCDENGNESGKRTVVTGRKYQHLQDTFERED